MSNRRAFKKRPEPIPDTPRDAIRAKSRGRPSSSPYRSPRAQPLTQPLTIKSLSPVRVPVYQSPVRHSVATSRTPRAYDPKYVITRQSNGLSKRTLDTLTMSGYTTLKAIRLMTEDDLRDLDISLGQRSLLRAVVARLNAEEGRYDAYTGEMSVLLMVSGN